MKFGSEIGARSFLWPPPLLSASLLAFSVRSGTEWDEIGNGYEVFIAQRSFYRSPSNKRYRETFDMLFLVEQVMTVKACSHRRTFRLRYCAFPP